jgi:hypothetical protein
MAVLLFHAERSTWYGKETDQHSQGQAISGVYSKKAARWIRGPAGVSRASWKRLNAELATEGGPIRRFRRTDAKTGNAPTEYAIDWLAIRSAIDQFRSHTPTAAEMPLLQQETGGAWLTMSQGLGSP